MKKLIGILLVAPFVSLAATLSDGLVAHYKFDGNANDSSGNGNDGVVLSATLTADRFGNKNNAYAFSGDYGIRVDGSTSLNTVRNDNMSVAFWAKFDGLDTRYAVIVDKRDGKNKKDQFGWHFIAKDGLNSSTGLVMSGLSGTDDDISSSEPLGEDWNHWVVSVSNGHAVLYKNGSVVGEKTYSTQLSSVDAAMFIGCTFDNSNSLYGSLDDIRIYNRAISVSEVIEIYNAGGDEPIVRTVTFDANGGTCATDSVKVSDRAAVGELPTATRSNYTFLGWFTAAVGGEQVSSETVVTADVTWYAQWKAVTPDPTVVKIAKPTALMGLVFVGEAQVGVLEFDERLSSGGCLVATNAGTYSAWFALPPESETEMFKWMDDSTNVCEVEWVIAPLEIDDARVSFGNIPDQVATGEAVTPAVVMSFDDDLCALGEDYVVSYSNNVDVGVGCATVTGMGNFTGVKMLDFVLVAPEPNKFTVTFDACGGDVEEPVRQVEEGAVIGALPVALRKGYDFDGWFVSEGDVERRVTDDDVVLADVVVMAHWTPIAYEIAYDLGENTTNNVNNPSSYTIEDDVVLLPPERSGFEFVGWTPDDGVITNGSIGAKTFTAQWKVAKQIYTVIVGAKASVDVGLKGQGYATKTLPKGLTYSDKTGLVTGTCKTAGEYEVTFTKKGEADVVVTFVVRAENTPTIACEGLTNGTLTVGVACGAAGVRALPISIDAESGIKSVTATKLPTGMKLASSKDKTSWYITGAPAKAGTYDVAITLMTAAGNKVTKAFMVTVAALPAGATGTFNGFVVSGALGDRALPDGDTANVGSLQVTVSDVGKITAKVVAAAGTYSFTATGWDSVSEGVYSVEMTTKKGDVLTLACDANASWNTHQLTGSFTAKGSTALSVEAQKNAFGKQWYFNATGDDANGWTLSFAESAKAAALTVTLKADGKTSVSGKLGAYKVSASGYADVSGIGSGAIFADFAPVISVGKTKKVLSLRVNLWFDKKDDHEEGVGSAVIVP